MKGHLQGALKMMCLKEINEYSCRLCLVCVNERKHCLRLFDSTILSFDSDVDFYYTLQLKKLLVFLIELVILDLYGAYRYTLLSVKHFVVFFKLTLLAIKPPILGYLGA